MKAGRPRHTAHRGQTWGLIKAQPNQPQTGFEVRHIKSIGSKVRHRTDLHLTLQLEMVISRCNDDPCLTVRDDTTVGVIRRVCVRVSVHTPAGATICKYASESVAVYVYKHPSWILTHAHMDKD